ncbi:hypothetical protein [Tropicimonas sediminicola]|uniref:Metal binding domain of Ada n=1 Tax=Tropicimonas sediminicola TaxID=1031541 RepID=A0A239HLM6_9RHOB|nr:hypothetical protein [Tropicimonas sediminicola]SNS81154.1 hypothetical protein SAMN05421757_103437 [Tropicimonas sediminicola]
MREPRQNRVLPTGEVAAIPERGLLMGNRGILHDAEGRLGVSRWRHPHWVCCVLSFKGRRREVMAPGRYTELFFLDEAVALAAGHRPCAECRRPDHEAFRDAWERAFGSRPRAPEIDRVLHAERATRDRRQIRHRADPASLPDGAMVLGPEGAALVLQGALLPFSPPGYGPRRPMPRGAAIEVLTPRATVDVLRAGYRPLLHPSASV